MKKTNSLAILAITATLAGCASSPSIHENGFTGITKAQQQQCKNLNNSDYMEQQAEQLLEKKWDRHAVGCGAIYMYQLASESNINIPLKLEALGAQLIYFDVLSHDYPKLYKDGELNIELNKLWRATRVRSEELIKSVEDYEFLLNEITLLKGTYVLAQSAHDTGVREQMKQAVKAKGIIEQAVASDPDSIDGLGLLLTARLYQDLPSFMGGDTEKSLALLNQLLQSHPENLEAIRWAIQAHEVLGQKEKAQQVLNQAANINPENINPQDHADLLLTLGGMAKRHGLVSTLSIIKEKRQALFKANPKLNNRKQAATMGHGSADPITGKDSHDL